MWIVTIMTAVCWCQFVKLAFLTSRRPPRVLLVLYHFSNKSTECNWHNDMMSIDVDIKYQWVQSIDTWSLLQVILWPRFRFLFRLCSWTKKRNQTNFYQSSLSRPKQFNGLSGTETYSELIHLYKHFQCLKFEFRSKFRFFLKGREWTREWEWTSVRGSIKSNGDGDEESDTMPIYANIILS